MKNISIAVKDAYQIRRNPAEDMPGGSAQKRAILLVKVLGSPEYFKLYGDRAGREWLYRYHNLTEGFVADVGGTVAKATNESVWVYFMSPENAVEGAINIHEKFALYNANNSLKETILVRIGVHFGDVIIERQEIFGNVANLIAKVVSRLSAGDICITQEVHDQIKAKTNSPIVPFPQKDRDEPSLFLLKWNKPQKPEPPRTFKGVLIYLRPVWPMANEAMRRLWEMLSMPDLILPSFGLMKSKALPNRTLIFAFDTPTGVFQFIPYLFAILNKSLGGGSSMSIPLQAFIHSANYQVSSDKPPPALPVQLDQMTPGLVFISPDACRVFPNPQSLPLNPAYNPQSASPFYQWTGGKESQPGPSEIPCDFQHRAALVQGPLAPCFYCGSRRHRMGLCPSKKKQGRPDALERMGYLSPLAINQHAWGAIMAEQGIAVKDGDSPSQELIMDGFLELKMVFQLRMLDLLWDADSERWDDIIRGRSVHRGRRGGQVWLAFNCLQSSNYERAKEMIRLASQEQPNDFRLHCIMGFMSLEFGDAEHARYYFVQALECARSIPHIIFLNFCLFRMAMLKNDQLGCEKCLREILSLNPRCSEARYFQLWLRFRFGDSRKAAMEIADFIHSDYFYFVYLLIEPDLMPWHSMVIAALSQLFAHIRKDAENRMAHVRHELDRFAQVMGHKTEDAEYAWNKIQELEKTGSYLGYLEIAHIADSWVSQVRERIQKRQHSLLESLNALNNRCSGFLLQLDGLEQKKGPGRMRGMLKRIQEEIQGYQGRLRIQSPNIFKETESGIIGVRESLDQAEFRLKIYRSLVLIGQFFATFLKVTLILQCVNVVVSMFLLPVVLRYGVSLIMPLNPSYMPLFQVGTLIVGGAFAFFFAIWRGIRRLQINHLQ